MSEVENENNCIDVTLTYEFVITSIIYSGENHE